MGRGASRWHAGRGLKPETKARVFATEVAKDTKDVIDLRPQRAALLNEITQHADGISIDRLGKVTNSKNLYATLHALEEAGFIRIERQLTKQASVKKETVIQLAPNLSIGSEELSIVLNALEKHAQRLANILLAIVQQMQMEPDRPMSAPLLIKKAGASASTFKALREKGFIVTTQTRTKGCRNSMRYRQRCMKTMISNIALDAGTAGREECGDKMRYNLKSENVSCRMASRVPVKQKVEYISLARTSARRRERCAYSGSRNFSPTAA